MSASVIADWERQDSVATVGYRQAYENTAVKLSAETKSRLRFIPNNSETATHATEHRFKQAYLQARHALRAHTERMLGDTNLARYESFLNRRRTWEAEEARQIDALVREQFGIVPGDDEPYLAVP